ncbi:MAG: LPS-assembly protein LptD, partial [Leptospiraceae bacterium]|nr:LPS-assembly protein LptD [Leptospiraceae bacterium]
MRFFFLVYFLIHSIFAQDWIQNLTQITPPKKETSNEITKAQKKLLRKVIDSLSDREVEEYLVQLGLSAEGSVYTKRIRLKEYLAKEELTEQTPETQKETSSPFIIENANEGEYVSIDKTKGGVLILRGRVKIKVKEGTLSADSISIDSKRNEIYAEGTIVYKKGNLEVKGDKFIYDIELERGIIYDAKANLFPIYFVGKTIKKIDENKYLLDVGYFTSCNAEVPHYRLKAKKIFVYEDQSVIATDLWYNVGGSNLFYLPIFYGTNLGTGWVVQMGRNRTQGSFVQTSFQWSEPLSGVKTLSPVGRKIKIDYYEKTGPHLGFEFWKLSPWLNYNMDLGVADFRDYRVASRYTNLNQFRLGQFNDVVVTNQVDKGEKCIEYKGRCVTTYSDLIRTQDPNFNSPIRNYGERHQTWWKANIITNAKSNNLSADGTRNVFFRFEYYTNPRFEYEFGYRYVPSNTLQSLYTFRTQRNPFVRQNLIWDLDYTENRGDLSINLAIRRNWTYYFLNPQDRSNYFPIRDELPRLSIRNSSLIGYLPYSNSPVYWDINFNSMIVRQFGPPVKKPLVGSTPTAPIDDPYGKYRENLLRTEYFGRLETGFRSNINLGAYTSFTPGVYIGMNKQSVERADTSTQPSTADLSIERYFKRESYQFIRQNHRLSFGIPELLFSTTYRRTDARNRELPDPVLKDGRDAVHEMEFSLESHALEDLDVSIHTIRDLRQFSENYNPQPKDRERWYFTILRIGAFYDFYDGVMKKRATLLERKRSFFSGVFVNNDYVYHTAQN